MNAERETRLPLRDAPAEGTVRLLQIGRHCLGLYRIGEQLHALADRCPHRGAPLCAGRVATPIELHEGAIRLGKRGAVVRCPWHKWEFDIATGRCLVDERLRVRRYPVQVVGEEIVVTLDEPVRTSMR